MDVATTAAAVFHGLIGTYAEGRAPRALRILDLGCGKGALVRALEGYGYSCAGCDMDSEAGAGLDLIQWSPYRLPYADASFDVVISNQVIEHVQNKPETLSEVARVLKPGGLTVHVFPSKWSIIEPHIFVPLVSWFWPRVPGWWLSLWAILGVRNRFQHGLPWREVVQRNAAYCATGLDYRNARELRQVFGRTVGPVTLASRAYVEASPGRAGRLLRRLPGKRLTAELLAILQMRTVVAAKV